jgi:hypothetical protein
VWALARFLNIFLLSKKRFGIYAEATISQGINPLPTQTSGMFFLKG